MEDDSLCRVKGHPLQCKHRPVSDAEAALLLREEGIELSQIPPIFADDPALESIRVPVGTVIEVTRPEVFGFPEHRYYRRIVIGW